MGIDVEKISEIINRKLLVECLSEIKAFRNQWYSRRNERKEYPVCYFDIGGDDYDSYKFMIENCRYVSIQAIQTTVLEMLELCEKEINHVNIYESEGRIYLFDEAEKPLWQQDSIKRKPVLAFIYNNILYVFKEFGIKNHLPNELLVAVSKKHNSLQGYCYVSMVEDGAYYERLDRNDNSNDPTHGTGIYSLKWFIEHFFNDAVYLIFKEATSQLDKEIDSYIGIKVVRTLKPNALGDFRAVVKDSLLNYDYQNAIRTFPRVNASQPQAEDIEKVTKQFIFDTGNRIAMLSLLAYKDPPFFLLFQRHNLHCLEF